MLASGSADGTVRLWDVAGQRELLTVNPFGGREMGASNFTAQFTPVLTLDFTPDGQTLVVAGEHESVAIVDLTYFDRHIAGNRAYQVGRFEGTKALRHEDMEVLHRGGPTDN